MQMVSLKFMPHKVYSCTILKNSEPLQLNFPLFALATGILVRQGLAKMRTMAAPDSPDMPSKSTKKVRFHIYRTQIRPSEHYIVPMLGK